MPTVVTLHPLLGVVLALQIREHVIWLLGVHLALGIGFHGTLLTVPVMFDAELEPAPLAVMPMLT